MILTSAKRTSSIQTRKMTLRHGAGLVRVMYFIYYKLHYWLVIAKSLKINHYCQPLFVCVCLCCFAGSLKKFNSSVFLFMSISPNDKAIPPERKKDVPVYHAKGCSGGIHEIHKGDPLWRVTCKETWLKEHDQWFLPPNLPTTMQSWLDADDALIAKLKALLHAPRLGK